MALITIRNPANGEQQAIDDTLFDPNAGQYAGWEKIADGLPLDDLKQVKAAAVDQALAAAFLGGFTPSTGPLAGHTLQVRDDTDRTNWLTSQTIYSAQVSAGNGATVAAEFRDAENVLTTVSYADGLGTLLAMGAWGFALMKNSWALKDAITAAADQAALDAIDITTGWA